MTHMNELNCDTDRVKADLHTTVDLIFKACVNFTAGDLSLVRITGSEACLYLQLKKRQTSTIEPRPDSPSSNL